MENQTTQQNADIPLAPAMKPKKSQRLASLDALRGFDMLWITGGAGLAGAAAAKTQWPWLGWFAGQMRHVSWHGFAFFDLIFPLFIFLAGVSISFAISKKLENNVSKWKILLQITRRGILLILLGCIYNGMLKFPGWANIRYASVLGHIGIAYFFAALIYMFTDSRHRIIWASGLLIGYWASMKFIAIPGFASGDFTMAGNMASYIDHNFLPGHVYRGIHDPQGLFIAVSAISGCVIGTIIGDLLRNDNIRPIKKVAFMFITGIIALFIARLWHSGFHFFPGFWTNPVCIPTNADTVNNYLSFPINKEIWTSSFVIYTTGWALLLLSFFYLVMDVWKIRWPAFFFMVIGMNSITIYLGQSIVNFHHTKNFIFGGFIKWCDPAWHGVLNSSLYILCWWIVLLVCYRKKIFLKI